MKRIYFPVLLSFICVFFIQAQNVTNVQELQRIAAEKAELFKQEKQQALEYARLNDIPVTFETDEGVLFELMRIDEFGQPQYYITENAVSAASISTSNLHPGGSSGLSLDGTGITVREWDGGAVLATHQEYNGRVVMGDGVTSTHYHATHVAGTMIASGVDAGAKGMAPNADLRAFDWNSDESEMASEASAGALMSNHSYGYGRGWVWTGSSWTWYGNTSISTQEDYLFGFYDTQAQDWDQIAANAPYYLIVKSAGNDRGDGPTNGAYPQDGPYDCVSHAGVAKNILTVGAVEDVPGGYSGPSSVTMSSFSSWGPCDDGRIKPDISTNGVGLYSTDDANNSSYYTLSGTSMASPSACGSLALLQQHYENLNGSGNYMKAATTKALVIHTADEAGSYDGPDYQFGWGLMNTESAALVISDDQNDNLIDELTLSSGGTYTRDVDVDGTEPLKVTISWTDVPGTPVSAQLDPIDAMLVNDLDLRISGNSNTYYPWKLDRDNPSAAATNNGENNVDNVEVVYIASPVAGTYTITVDHDGTLSGGSQDFSIVITGITTTPVTDPPVANFFADDTTPNTGETVVFNDQSTNGPTSWSWSFNPTTVTFVNGTSSTSQNPEVTFDADGTYTVTLVATNAYGSDTETKTDYITATTPPPFSLPWTEGFEEIGATTTYTSNSSSIDGLPEWAYEKTGNGRLRFSAGSGFYRSGSHAATLDADPSGTYSVNYFSATLDLSSYSTSTNLELAFSYMDHAEESHSNDRVWIRGSDSDNWIQVYDLYSGSAGAGVWNDVNRIDIDNILSSNGQTPTSTFQLRLGQEDNYPATSTTASDGWTFDDIVVSEVDPSQYIISTFPYSQSWENGLGLWEQGINDDFDWSRNSGGTPSSSTGPTGAHNGSYYMYTEASSPRLNGDEAYLEATFDFTALTAPQLSFWYHMYGASIHSLHVDVYDGSVWTSDVWVVTGQQQANQTDPYLQAVVDLAAWEGMNDIKVRFRGIVGSGANSTYYSDIAIDLIEVAGTTPQEPPLCTTPVSPLDGATGVLIDATLNWNAAADATGYILYFGTDNPPTNLENGTDLGNVTSYTPATMDYSTGYYWQVIPYNAAGDATGCSVWTFTTEDVPPPPVCTTPVSPVDGETNVSINGDLSWNSVGDADGYVLYLGTDNPPTNMVNGVDLGNVTTYDPGTLGYLTDYYWQVVPYNNYGSATGCATWTFTTEDVPPPPVCTTPVSPVDGETNVSINGDLSWNSVGDADGYVLYLGTDNPPTNMVNGVDLGNVTTYDPGTLGYLTDYYWQVVPYNAYGSATGCPVWSFTTQDSGPTMVELSYSDFETGWGIWTDGGNECMLYTGGTYASQGSNAADIQGASGVESSFYMTTGEDVHTPGYVQIDVEFEFLVIEFDNHKDDFWVQYYDGSAWHTVATFVHGTDFSNDIFYAANVSILESNYNFPTDMKIRFMCDAKNHKDDVYIDVIRITATDQVSPNNYLYSIGQLNNALGIGENGMEGFAVYPNPVNEVVHINVTDADNAQLFIYDLTGKQLYENNLLNEENVIDISDYVDGVYMVRVVTHEKVFTKKLIKR